jgi:acyl-CoA thioester hydrolase
VKGDAAVGRRGGGRAGMREVRQGSVEMRVRYPEVDRMGVAHHSHHFVWFEIGRTELMRASGVTYRALEDEGIFLPVIEAECAYRAPARYDDRIRVVTEIASAGPVRVAFRYRVERVEDGALLASGGTRHAAVDRNGRPRRLPAGLLERLV